MGLEIGGRWVGQPVARVEDRRHLTGDANFVDDIRTAGVLHVAFARSPTGRRGSRASTPPRPSRRPACTPC